MKKIEDSRDFLDIAFTEIPEGLQILQEPLDFKDFQVREGRKGIVDMSQAIEPHKLESYAFAGHIQQITRGKLVYSRPTFKYDIAYTGGVENNHIFIASETSIIQEEYEGCSGAPIFDGQGNLAAIARAVSQGTKIIYPFPVSRLKLLIDTVLAVEAIEKSPMPPKE